MARNFTSHTVHNVMLEFEDEIGNRQTEKFSVRYRSYSQKVLDELEALEAGLAGGDEKKIVPFSAYLGVIVEEMIGENGEALHLGDETARREFFNAMSIRNTKAIYDAIENDINPDPPIPSSEPGNSGSSPAASEG